MTATKNNLPWTGLLKLPKPINPEYLSILQEFWKTENWGDNFENYKRPQSQSAIYPCTRAVQYLPHKNQTNHKLKLISDLIAKDLQQFFIEKMSFWVSELVLLTPEGIIPWHHDSLELCRLSSRIIIPLTPTAEIEYYFCSWNKKTPTDLSRFSAAGFLSDDVQKHKMEFGNYYFFNHRVPHFTRSKSVLPRGTFSIDMIPDAEYKNFFLNNSSTIVHGNISEFEKTKIN